MRQALAAALAASTATLALGLAGLPASAEYPDRPVQFVVPWPPGDLEDVLTRMIAEDFSAKYGVPAAVVNKPGGGGGPFPGAAFVATAPADGSVIGSFVFGVPIIGPTLGLPEIKADTFEPIGIFLTYPFVLAAAKDAPFATMQELAEHAKANPVALGHFGAGLEPTKVSLALARAMGFEWGSDAAFDALDCNTLASGDVDVINTTLQLVLPCLDQIRVLASITDTRISLTPDAPTVGELVPDLSVSLWNGLFVTRDVPAEVREKVAAVARETIASPRAQQVAKDTGALLYWKDAEESRAQIAADTAKLARIGAMLGQ